MARISVYLWTTIVVSRLAAAAAASIVYVTDLSIYTLLAPCAQTALSYNIFTQTYSACGEAPTDLQSCICTKNNNLAAVSTSVSKPISYSCGSTASEDQTSAAAVLSQYCNPDATVAFATPTTNIVTKYATDIAEFSNMAPCAQSGVSYALSSMTSLCPEPASLMAPCICTRNDNSARVSRSVASLVRYSCSNAADVTSGLAFYDAYCAMNKGTTAFPQPSPPPGDMTYYMTALTQYSALAPCAQSGISNAMYSITSYQCPEGPQALASCICLKDGVTNLVTSTMTSNVKYYCSSTASDDVSSALAVLDFYCKAARNEVVATVRESVAQTYATAKAGTGSDASRSQPTSTSSSAAGGGADNNDTSSGGPGLAAIVGGVVAVIGGLSIAGLVGFMIYRRRKTTHARFPITSTTGPLEMNSPPELGGTMLSTLPPKNPQMSVSYTGSPRPDTVSPVATPNSMFPPPPPPPAPLGAELHGQGRLPHEMPASSNNQFQSSGQYMPAELQGQHGQAHYVQGGYSQPQGGSTVAEAHSQPIHQMPGGPQPVYQVPGQQQQQQRAELQGMGWHAGPMPGYSEMDAGQQRR
ncbi:uncharacterized protein LY79DRAFT_593674 [Colletotrichum navitas]|uniref:Syndecan/Neurexin domain-containing protein n=1 Tax=Colletotrichum navitas TaxID=681940 RepID=A0AAD8PP96_9PEZI|nr:uncharacterized protein LY79DRAFT_593674 [Colletotrichum navitas]KAK1573880.1 hypothetical protein LY79DRAFT_593674 [Colletotrichum navitas]